MEPSQQHESPGKDGDKERVERRSVGRFKALARKLFAVDREQAQRALDKEAKRRGAKRP
jgi:hypothetical protein